MAASIPPLDGDERTLLLAFLADQRTAVVRKCAGLGDELAHRRLLAATSPAMSVAGVVGHLRWVEHVWFEHRLLGEPNRHPKTRHGQDSDFQVDDVPLTRLLADYARQCARSDEIIATLGLDAVAKHENRDGGHASARWILLHMIEETARHAGHLDILREQLDGTTGI